MDDRKLDNLEKLFKSRLNTELKEDKTWNVPPDEILDNALYSVNKLTKERNKFYILSLLVALFIVSIVSFNIYYVNKIDQLNNEIDQLNSQHQTQVSTKHNLLIGENKINKKADNIDLGLVAEKKSKTHSKTSKSNTSTSIFSKINTLITDNIKQNSFLVNNAIDQTKIIAPPFYQESIIKTSAVLSPKQNESIVLTPLPTLRLAVPGLTTKLALSQQISPTILPKPESTNRGFSVYLLAGYNYSALRITNMDQIGYSLSDYDKHYAGYKLGFGILQNLSNRINLNYEFAYGHVNNKSTFQNEMSYDKSNEKMNDAGDMMYDTSIDIESPMGEYTTNADFMLRGANFSNDEMLTNITDIEIGLKTINFSVSGEYTAFQFGKLNFYLDAGIGANYLFGMQQNMDIKIYHLEDMMMQKEHSIDSMEGQKTFYISAHGGLGIGYYTSNNLAFRLKIGIEDSLTPIRKSDETIPVNTYLRNTKTALSIAYPF